MNKIMDYMFFGCPIVAFDLKERQGFSTGRGSVCDAQLRRRNGR